MDWTATVSCIWIPCCNSLHLKANYLKRGLHDLETKVNTEKGANKALQKSLG